MAVYQTSGVYLPVFENNPGYLAADVINNITGGQGAKYLRVLNSSSSNVATFSWTLDSQVYSYANVSATSGTGSGARFNVTFQGNGAGSAVYSATINNPGAGYSNGNSLTVAGELLGGTTPDNNLNMVVDTVDPEDGAILTVIITESTPNWPPSDQAPTGVTNLLPNSETVVQVVPGSTISTGMAISTTGAGTDIIYVEAVTVIA